MVDREQRRREIEAAIAEAKAADLYEINEHFTDLKLDPLPIGTRIRFTKTLEEGPTEEHPGRLYARAGELGTIVGHGTKEGYWVVWDGWDAKFGASEDEFEVL